MANKTKKLDVLNEFFSEKSIEEITNTVKNGILKNELDVLTMLTHLKKAEQVIKNILNDNEIKSFYDKIKDYILPKFKKHDLLGVEITRIVENNINYESCGHTEYNDLVKIINSLNKRKEEIELEINELVLGYDYDTGITETLIYSTNNKYDQLSKNLDKSNNLEALNKLTEEINDLQNKLIRINSKVYKVETYETPELKESLFTSPIYIQPPVIHTKEIIRVTSKNK